MTPENLILKNVNKSRGKIISEVALLERYVDQLIAKYFCSTDAKYNEFIDLILGSNRMSFSTKTKVIESILRKYDKEIFKRIPDYNKHMKIVMEERNAFAHNVVDSLSDEAIHKSKTHIGLIKFGSNRRTDWYDEKRINNILESIRYCTKQILIFLGENP